MTQEQAGSSAARADADADRRLRRCADAKCGHPHYWIDGDPATGVMYRCPSDAPEQFGYDVRFHVPQIARRSDGRWGVFCAACSHAMSDYINPCQAFQQDEWPPAILSAAEQADLDRWAFGVGHLVVAPEGPTHE